MKLKTLWLIGLVGLVAFVLLVTLPASAKDGVVSLAGNSSKEYAPSATMSLYLPMVSKTANLLCRLGLVGVSRSISTYDAIRPGLQAPSTSTSPSVQPPKTAQVSRPLSAYVDYLKSLRAGWYADFSTSTSPSHPDGIQYAQTISVKQYKQGHVLYGVNLPYEQPYTYAIFPPLPTIQTIAAANPGSLWLVGNEIERRDWADGNGNPTGQNEILPEVYVSAYHDVYTAIKAADPTALVANGSIIAPTPLRMQYMARMWNAYQSQYGAPMPVDVWNIHLYFGPEVRNSWGIDIPAGIDNVTTGMFYFGGNFTQQVLVSKDYSYAPGLVTAFRSWMKSIGQQNKPLVITENSVSMPDWVMPGQFTPEQVRDSWMYPSLNYYLNQTDPNLGYPADGYRLVQSAWWWSLDADAGSYNQGIFDEYFNGNLLWSGIGAPTNAPYPMGLSTLGNYWINYVSPLAQSPNPPFLPCSR